MKEGLDQMQGDKTGHEPNPRVSTRRSAEPDTGLQSVVRRPVRFVGLEGVTQQATARGEPEDKGGQPAVDQQERITVVRPFSELPVSAMRALVTGWVAFVLVIFFSFGGGLDLALTLGIVAVFALAFLGTPFILLRIGKRIPPAKPAENLQTFTGELSHGEALLQIALLPFLLAVGIAVFGVIARHAAG